MKAHDAYLTSLLKLSDAVFNIPVYQRNYDWDTDNCQQLFSDLETITFTGKDHFIGSIVYISIGTATGPEYNIIDGQQRITSVMLLLKALYDSSNDEMLKKQIKRGFLVNIGFDDTPKMKLKQVESDSTVYEKIIMQEVFNEDVFTTTEKATHVYRNYLFFKDRISQSSSELQDLFNAVFKLEIIDVCLTTEDPQEVFESMNSTGKSLTNTDLLRNYLLMDLTHSKQERLYKKYWSQIEKNVGLERMEQYMVHYLIMKRKSDSMHINRRSAKVNKNTLYDSYKIYFPPESKQDDGTEKLMEDMYRYSVLYRKIVNNDNVDTPFAKAVYELIHELNADSVAVFLLYLLNVQQEQEISNEDMLSAVQACISYVFRLRIFKESTSNQFFALAIQYFERADENAPFVTRVWDALTSGQGRYRFPKDREFRNTFENMDIYLEFKPPMIRYILYKYERRRTKEIVNPENVTIEHILPQEPKEWLSHLAEIHDTSYLENTHKIGNLTLTKLNSEISNDRFEKKKRFYADSGYAITREISEYEDWNSSKIRKRSSAMAAEAVDIWPLPDEYNQNSPVSTWQIMDDETEELFDELREMIKDYDHSIYEETKKDFINFMSNKKYVLSIVPCQNYLTVVLNADPNKLSPNDRLEENKGHRGVGECKMKVSDPDDVWLIISYIEQIMNGSVPALTSE